MDVDVQWRSAWLGSDPTRPRQVATAPCPPWPQPAGVGAARVEVRPGGGARSKGPARRPEESAAGADDAGGGRRARGVGSRSPLPARIPAAAA